MKEYVINKCMNLIKKNCDFDDTKLQEIRYGLASLYLQATKFIIITTISIILNIFVPYIIFTICYNIIRKPSFGLHASKGYLCWIFSTLLFIGIPFISKYMYLNINTKIIICIIGIVLMFKNSPADTLKKPIVSKKRRNIYKFCSVIIAITYSFLIIYLRNQMVVNCLICALILQNIIISKYTYQVFNLPYDNYKRWEGHYAS